jgi:hypothetical protein
MANFKTRMGYHGGNIARQKRMLEESVTNQESESNGGGADESEADVQTGQPDPHRSRPVVVRRRSGAPLPDIPKGERVMDRQSQHLPEADNSAAASGPGVLIEPLNLEQGRRAGCGPVEAVPVEPPVILAMTMREAVLLRYFMDLATRPELTALAYRLSCKLSIAMVDLHRPPNTNQHEPTNS